MPVVSCTIKDLPEVKLHLGSAVVTYNTSARSLFPVFGAKLHAQPAFPPQAASPESVDRLNPNAPSSMSLSTHFSVIIFPEMFPKSLANSSSHVHILSHGLALVAPSLLPLLGQAIFAKQMKTFCFSCSGTVSSLLQI